ncbi:MAG TPA: GNAT family N-acetyltransferase [Pirellulales bacterium]|nr:GNAT family N-acetyltransferase [Pirellulales bacterium]
MNRSLVIETPRFLLRPFRQDDLDALSRLNANPQVMRHLGSGRCLDRGETWRQIAMILGHAQLRGYSILAIEDRESGALLGRTGPFFPEGWPMLEVGWVVDPARQRQGIATEVGRASIDWCFQNLGVDAVCSLIHPDNLASARVAEKLGARIEDQVQIAGISADLWVHRPRKK